MSPRRASSAAGGHDRLELQYSYGVGRATNDVDLVVDLSKEQVPDFVAQFERDIYIARKQVEDALRFGRFSNLIHLGSFYKFNFFPLRASDFHRREFARRRYAHAGVFGSSEIEFPVASAEDIGVSKLAWYRACGEVSEQQWNDILGVIGQRGDHLDLDYLRESAQRPALRTCWNAHSAGSRNLTVNRLVRRDGKSRPHMISIRRIIPARESVFGPVFRARSPD